MRSFREGEIELDHPDRLRIFSTLYKELASFQISFLSTSTIIRYSLQVLHSSIRFLAVQLCTVHSFLWLWR